MNSFKSGSGDLDFGGTEDDEKDDPTAETTGTPPESDEESESIPVEQPPSERPASDQGSIAESTISDPPEDEYPYFVRRSNVGDERDTRLEIHVRDKVADREAAFRSNVAEHLETTEISKTDAREFALLTAFQRPERVAELMRKEGFDALD